jgi:hypothetical protein
MRILGLFVCIGVVVAFASGCSTPAVPPPPPVATVKGTVEMDGKPMKSGDIEFETMAQPSKSLKIEDGVFSGEVFTGKNTVRVHLYVEGDIISTDPDKKRAKKESLPAKYNEKSTLSADVPSAGLSDLKFEVTSK